MKLKTQRGFALGTLMSTVEVPDKLRHKQSTGLDFVDAAVGGGGLTPSTVLMLTGMPGAGKSTLLRQLADSLAGQGCIVVYNTGEESLFQAKMTCERMGLTCNFMVGEETDASALIDFLKAQQRKNPGKQVVLLQDSLQTLDDGKYANGGKTGNTPVRCTEMLTDWAKETYGICIFIGQVTKSGDFAGKQTIKHAIDVHATLMYDEQEKSDTYGCLLFEVNKNRYGCSGVTFIVGITDKGIEERGSFSKAMQGRKVVGE